jgi:hypothetical protein
VEETMFDLDDVSTRERLHGTICPVHRDHILALVREAPGPRTRADCPFYPYPRHSAAGRLLSYLEWTRSQYLLTFARMNLLTEWPGPSFPVARARDCVPKVVCYLYPRPMLLMGKGVAAAFGIHDLPPLVLREAALPHKERGVVLARVAIIPHTSGRNLWYNDPSNRIAVREFVNSLVEHERDRLRDRTGAAVPRLHGGDPAPGPSPVPSCAAL